MREFTVIMFSSLSLLLSGCNTGSSIRVQGSMGQWYQLEGETLQLHESLQVGAGRARVFIQNGKARVGYDINEYATQCNFEVDSVAHQGLAIEADSFRIERIQGLYEEVVLARPVRVAALHLGMFESSGDSAAFEGYHFWLRSARQPQVRRMTCRGVFAESLDRRPPTLAEIRQTLGELVTIGS